jgi:nicotinate-nucleotide adenylyltransferase
MVEAAIAGDSRFTLTTIEMEREGPSYSVDTLRLLRAKLGAQALLYLIVGWDMLASLPTWHDAPGVVAGADQIVAAQRPGYGPGYAGTEEDIAQIEARLPGLRHKLWLLQAPQLDLAATSIRDRVGLGLPIRYLVPEAVEAYIARHQLYHAEGHASAAEDHRTGGEAP